MATCAATRKLALGFHWRRRLRGHTDLTGGTVVAAAALRNDASGSSQRIHLRGDDAFLHQARRRLGAAHLETSPWRQGFGRRCAAEQGSVLTELDQSPGRRTTRAAVADAGLHLGDAEGIRTLPALQIGERQVGPGRGADAARCHGLAEAVVRLPRVRRLHGHHAARTAVGEALVV
ncbi:MAG: hypothetical protein ACPGUV_04770, partial [Polyangiales bacterium]